MKFFDTATNIAHSAAKSSEKALETILQMAIDGVVTVSTVAFVAAFAAGLTGKLLWDLYKTVEQGSGPGNNGDPQPLAVLSPAA